MNPIPSKIILASQSARRKSLLEAAGLQFETINCDIDESFPSTMPTGEVASYIAKQKLAAALKMCSEDTLVICADTIVLCEKEILGKPNDKTMAFDYLTKLSDKNHQVITGVSIAWSGQQIHFSNVTQVYFNSIDDHAKHYYIDHYQPFDKAGAYAIQEWIGLLYIEKIEGSYFNVVGLPVQELIQSLKKWQLSIESLRNMARSR
ncbi:UNVERIFIED_CONTAM: hypothetical protein GTU68_048064 [Idotea baltica]|nr:hypothetical protein [Idotea baltica]